MNLLAFDTSTDQLSAAASRPADGGPAWWTYSGPGAAQASASLIPALLDLLAPAGLTLKQLDAIAFGAGPGSFTGLRTACAVAQGLGYGAEVPLLPVDTLLAVAEEARLQLQTAAPDEALSALSAVMQALAQGHPCGFLVALDARMDEVYSARYLHQAGAWHLLGDWQVGKPELLQAQTEGDDPATPWLLVGNADAVYGPRLPDLPRLTALPTARALLSLAPALLAAGQAVPAAQALPRYVRDKVAQTTAERAALQSAKTPAPSA